MPESRLERTRKLYNELNVRLLDTTKPYWWLEDYERLADALKGTKAVVKSDANA